MTNKSAPAEFPLDEIDLLVGWRAGEDEFLFTKAVAMVREWLLDTEEKDRLRDVLKEIVSCLAQRCLIYNPYLHSELDKPKRED